MIIKLHDDSRRDFNAGFALLCHSDLTDSDFIIAIGGLSDMERLRDANNAHDADQPYSYRVMPIAEIR